MPFADGGVLPARVRAVPEKDAANAARVKLVADVAGWPKSSLDIEAGSKSRVKVVSVSGEPERPAAEPERLAASRSFVVARRLGKPLPAFLRQL